MERIITGRMHVGTGWLEEVKSLLASGTSEDAKPFRFIGYRELRGVLQEEISLAEAREAIQRPRAAMQNASSHGSPGEGVRWFSGFGDEPP